MVIIQKPNAPLILALIGYLISFFGKGLFHTFGHTLFITAIIIWAFLEVTQGASWFRKILGFVVLTGMFFSLFNQLK